MSLEYRKDPGQAWQVQVVDGNGGGGGGGGSGVVLGDWYASGTDTLEVMTDTTVPFSGVAEEFSPNVAGLAAASGGWLNDAGEIVEPGLYNFIMKVRRAEDPTGAQSLMPFTMPFNVTGVVDMEVLNNITPYMSYIDIQAVAGSDLPIASEVVFFPPDDPTGEITVALSVSRLAYDGGAAAAAASCRTGGR